MQKPRPPPPPATPKTSSAAMIVRHPKAQPVLSPLIVCGSAAGINTSLTSLKPRNPRLRPTMRMVGLTVRKPVLTLIAMGHVTALAMTKTSAAGLRPNQSIASGRIAIAGSGLSIEVNSTSTSSPMRVHVAKVVSTAEAHPYEHPQAQYLQGHQRRGGQFSACPALPERLGNLRGAGDKQRAHARDRYVQLPEQDHRYKQYRASGHRRQRRPP